MTTTLDRTLAEVRHEFALVMIRSKAEGWTTDETLDELVRRLETGPFYWRPHCD